MDITKEQLENLYVKQGLTFRQCATVFGFPTHGNLSRLFKKYAIQTRKGKFQKGNQINKGKSPELCSNWKGGKQVVLCDSCGKELKRFPSHIHDKNFCGNSCYGQWRIDNFKGENNPNYGNSILVRENNPNWKGGITHEPYAPIWIDKRFKAGIKERDNFACQNPECRGNCDRLTIHHIDYDKKNCEPDNLITLCIGCNARANFNREFWEAGYREIIHLKYWVNDNENKKLTHRY